MGLGMGKGGRRWLWGEEGGEEEEGKGSEEGEEEGGGHCAQVHE